MCRWGSISNINGIYYTKEAFGMLLFISCNNFITDRCAEGTQTLSQLAKLV